MSIYAFCFYGALFLCLNLNESGENMRDRIEIAKELIPYTFEISLADELFNITVNYNSYADMFTLMLEKDGEVICAGEPLVYGVHLWENLFICGKYPELNIIPFDESGDMDRVTFENLNERVFLTIDNGDD